MGGAKPHCKQQDSGTAPPSSSFAWAAQLESSEEKPCLAEPSCAAPWLSARLVELTESKPSSQQQVSGNVLAST